MKTTVRPLLVAACLVAAFLASFGAPAAEVRLAQQFGVSYLPLIVMKNQRLVEKHARSAGLGDIKVTWNQFGSGADMNTALIAGSLDFASGGIGPVLQIWGRTREANAVRGVASLGSLPLYLNTINPAVKSLRDFGDKDRIALPAVKVSMQAVLLQMAAAQIWGPSEFARLDRLTVSMRHPDATAALLSGTEITANFSASPFQEQQLADPRVRRLLSSYDLLGDRATLNSLYASARFREGNPRVYAAVVAALREAMAFINGDKVAAARIYVEEEKSKLPVETVHKLIADAAVEFTTTPRGFMKAGEFMARTGALKAPPAGWKDVFFADVHGEAGS